MVNSGLKMAERLAGTWGLAAGYMSRRNLGPDAALTTQTIDARHHQKLFWPGRFMVY